MANRYFSIGFTRWGARRNSVCSPFGNLASTNASLVLSEASENPTRE